MGKIDENVVPDEYGKQENTVLNYIKTPNITKQKLIILPKEIVFDMENIYSNIKILKLIIKWRIHLIIILSLAIGLSALFSSSLFIKPKYKSTAVLYPSNLIPYSSETPTELMLQIFESDDIRDSLIKKLNLATHYDIDLTQNNAYTKLIKEFESNVDIRKTEYESVVIEIFDTDPQFACNMVKDMVTLFNMKARDLQRSKSKEVLKITKDQMDGKQKQIDTLQKRLNDLRMNYGILDYDIQAKESMRAYYKMLGNGQKGNANFLNSTIENLKEKGGEYVLLKEMFDAATLSFDKLKEEYEITLRDVEKKLTYTNYVSSPIPSDKKTYPIRWLIVTISSITTMFFALIIIALIENVRKKEKTKNNMSDV